MIPIGYLYKTIAVKPDWLKVDAVVDIYSLCGHVSPDFADYIQYWKFNGYWLFDSPEIIETLAQKENIDLSGMSLFYYEAFEQEYDQESQQWSFFSPDASFVTNVKVPAEKTLEGFDVATFSGHNNPECSPLSCTHLAKDMPVNKHCLFYTFEEAKHALESGLFEKSEPGPFRIFAVYSLNRTSPVGKV